MFLTVTVVFPIVL